MITDGIMAQRGSQEIRRDQSRSLMDELVKGMLPVRSRFTPDDRAGLIGHLPAIPAHGLSVTFHVPLLKICREAVHILVIGENDFSLSAKEIDIPDADESEDYRDVAPERCIPKVLVHLKSTLEQFAEVFESDVTGNG